VLDEDRFLESFEDFLSLQPSPQQQVAYCPEELSPIKDEEINQYVPRSIIGSDQEINEGFAI